MSDDFVVLQTECTEPVIGLKKCVRAGHVFTCMATSGYPVPPAYSMQYWSHASFAVHVRVPSFVVMNPGVFSLKCTVTYSYTNCPAEAVCNANYTGRVYGQYLY